MDNDEPRKVGRPSKKSIQENSPGGRKKVGRPKGDAAIINEYKARMLASPKSRKVLDKVFEAALDDKHKHQAAAWKMVLDRVAPVSAFEQDVRKTGGSSGIQIHITGVGAKVEPIEDAIDGEWTAAPTEPSPGGPTPSTCTEVEE